MRTRIKAAVAVAIALSTACSQDSPVAPTPVQPEVSTPTTTSQPAVSEACGLHQQGDGYTVCYEEGYRADAVFVRDVLNPATTRFRRRYGPSSTPVEVFLLAEPATVNRIMIRPGQALASGGPSYLAIYVMARSAPVMQGACCNGLGMPFTDVRYQRTVLVHEYSTPFLHRYTGFQKWAGWFIQGLEQYEGLTATGDADMWRRTAEKVYRANTVSCGRGLGGEEELIVSERYWAGVAMIRFSGRFR